MAPPGIFTRERERERERVMEEERGKLEDVVPTSSDANDNFLEDRGP